MLWNSHVWFSDSQGTFVADFPEVVLDSNIKSDYGDAWAILTTIRPMFDIPVIRDCPLTSVRKLTTAFDEALEDLDRTRESEVPEFIQPELNDKWLLIHGPWFVTVIIDEGSVPSFDIIGSKNINEAYWACEATAEMNGLDTDCCTALGPYASVEDAQFAKDYFSRVPMDGFDGSGYVEHLEELFAFLLPQYVEEGKSSLVIAVGCTGGHHRSVAVAHALAEFVRQKGYRVEEAHRDITR